MNTKRKFNLSAFIGTVLFVLLFSITFSYVYAYFTASSNKEYTINLATVQVNLVDSSSTALSSFPISLDGALPGDTLDFSSIKIKNTGSVEVYALLNLDVTITATNADTLHYNVWFDLNGNEVNSKDFAINETPATLMDASSSVTTAMKWKIPGDPVIDAYQEGTITATLGAYGVQTLLPDAEAYVNKDLFATYYICKNASNVLKQTSKNKFDIYEFVKNQNEMYSQGIVDGQSSIRTFEGKECLYASPLSTYNSDEKKSYYIPVSFCKENTQYTLSYSGYPSSLATGSSVTSTLSGLLLYYSDGSTTKGEVVRNKQEWQNIVITSEQGKTIAGFKISYSRGNLIYYADIQLEEGTAATDYEINHLNFTEVNTEPLMKVANKNKFDMYEFVDYQNSLYDAGTVTTKSSITTFEDTECLLADPTNMYNGQYYKFPVNCKENTQYTISYSGYPSTLVTGDGITESTNLSGLGVYYSDGSRSFRYILNKQEWQSRTITSTEGKTVVGIFIIYGKSNYIYYKNIQLEEGTTATDYEVPVRDFYNSETNVVTRNVGKIELTGTEDWYSFGGVNSVYRYKIAPSDLALGYCKAVCNYYELSQKRLFTNIDEICITTHPESRQINFFVEFSTLDEWTTYLAEQYAQGTPVTVWYVLETPTEEKVFTSKNLYDGIQYKYYETNGAQNCDRAATIYITKDATKNLDATTPQLGGELFDYLYNKSFVVSCKIRRYSDDVVTNPAIGYRLEDRSATSLLYTNAFKSEISADGKWQYIWISFPCIAEQYPSAYNCKIWLADYSAVSNRHFEVKDIQIEIGECPTDFEINSTDPTVYDHVKGVELRTVNGVSDTYNAETGTITRNIGKVEFDGTENWWLGQYPVDDSCIQFYYAKPSDMMSDISTTYNSHFANKSVVNGTKIGDNYNIYPSIADYGFTTVEDFKTWLAEQYAQGTPVTVWYVLKTPVEIAVY